LCPLLQEGDLLFTWEARRSAGAVHATARGPPHRGWPVRALPSLSWQAAGDHAYRYKRTRLTTRHGAARSPQKALHTFDGAMCIKEVEHHATTAMDRTHARIATSMGFG
jgi:hypothetical protein